MESEESMKIGDSVRPTNHFQPWHNKGTVISIEGRKWVSIAWTDGLIEKEHIDDLEWLRESR